MEICHSPELILRCYESLIREAERSPVFRKLLLARAEVAEGLREPRFGRPQTEALSVAELTKLRDRILDFRERVGAAQPA